MMAPNKHSLYPALILILFFLFPLPPGFAEGGCTASGCHAGIKDIVPMELEMMQLIKQTGQRHGDPDGCVVCHGGNPYATKKKNAHRSVPAGLKRGIGPKDFYPDPGSIRIVQNTCGVCHPGYLYRTNRSLMNTEAGKISGNLHTWGIEPGPGQKHNYGNYDIRDTDGRVPLGASAAYQTYMADLMQRYPENFPTRLKKLPKPGLKEIENRPELAAYTYQRQECQRCHIGVKGSQTRGDFRGMGCSACHMPYAADGKYRGNDASISKDEPGHIEFHRLQGNRKTGGIPVRTCAACHNRGKRIGVSFQGLMESAYAVPFDEKGQPALKLHNKNYVQLSRDLHRNTENSHMGNPPDGLLCQDCHTSMDVHGDGNIHGTTLAQVEIECTDCHGTPDSFPWELALGYGEHFGKNGPDRPARGLGNTRLLSGRQFGYKHDKKDGFLLSARGNPLGNVVKSDNSVIVYSARGKDFKVPLLKPIKLKDAWQSPNGRVAMSSVSAHLNRMECYTCHATWAPQCYGSHVRVDYRKDKKNRAVDWVASGNQWDQTGQTAESKRGSKGVLSNAVIEEAPAYLRWETPVLGINGEGWISPLIPGCQVRYTVIGKTGKVLVQNKMPSNRTEAEQLGQTLLPLSMDMAPAQPHTNQRGARSCESCHTRLKTAGLGADPGILPKGALDWSKITTETGVQVATVGTHWPDSRAFNTEEIQRLLKVGTCMGCHTDMADGTFWKRVARTDLLDASKHGQLMNQALKSLGNSR
ncbi:MAG: hypothetical protein MI862_08710 [Desulfobacterales bacterium]|nr:hypothetical protein [Desulfobacterales bacterium]